MQSAHNRNNLAKLAKTRERHAKVVSGGGPQPLERWRGCAYYADMPLEVDAQAAAVELGMTQVFEIDRLATVDVFIVSDIAALQPLISWVAQLRGSTVLVPGVLTGARKGPIVTYERAFDIKRIVFVSDRLKRLFSREASLLRDMSANTSWRFVDTADDFECLKGIAEAKKQNASVAGLFTDAEISATRDALPQYIWRHMFDIQGFLQFVRRVSLADSNLGAKQLGGR